MSGYYRKRFPVPTVHSIAPTSPTTEAIIIESYFANHPFFEALCIYVFVNIFGYFSLILFG